MFSSIAARALAIFILLQAGCACMLASFAYDPCTRAISGTLWDNGTQIGGIYPAPTHPDSLSPSFGTLINLQQKYLDRKINAYVHEVRGANVVGGYLSHITIWDWSSGNATLLHSFELVLDKEGRFSNAVFGCDDTVGDAWFHNAPNFGWSRWGTPHPVSSYQILVCGAASTQPTPSTIWYDGKPVDTEISLAPGWKRRDAGFEKRQEGETTPVAGKRREAEAMGTGLPGKTYFGKVERKDAVTTSW